MNKQFILFLVVLGLFLVAPYTFAGVKDALIEQREVRKEMLAGFVKGKSVISQGIHYVIIPELRSRGMMSSSSETISPQYSQIGSETNKAVSANTIEIHGNIAYYKVASAVSNNRSSSISANTTSTNLTTTEYRVVLNQKTGKFGMATGDIRVKLQSPDQAKSLAEFYNIKLKATFKHLGISYYSVSALQNVFDLERQLSEDSRVLKADVEIVEQLRKTR